MSGMITDHRRNLGRIVKIETLPIFPICQWPSQTIGDVYDFQFSLVGKVWDVRETVKSPIVWDFPDKWKLGLKIKRSSCQEHEANDYFPRWTPVWLSGNEPAEKRKMVYFEAVELYFFFSFVGEAC